jgi:hypothetical protein
VIAPLPESHSAIENLIATTELKGYAVMSPNTVFGLTPAERHSQAIKSVIAAHLSLANSNRLLEQIQRDIGSRKHATSALIRQLRPQPYDPMSRRALVAKLYDTSFALYRRIEDSLDFYANLVLRVGELVHLVQCSDSFDYLIKFSIVDVENYLSQFEHTDRLCQYYTQLESTLKRELTIKPSPRGDLSLACQIASSLYIPSASYFRDLGAAESIFSELVDRETADSIQTRVTYALDHPSSAGQIALSLATEMLKNRDDLKYVFVLSCRYLFSSLYCRLPLLGCAPEFSRRVAEMRKLSPLAFAANELFFPPQLRSVPISAIPAQNPYAEATGKMQAAVFQFCPIDFCAVIHDALCTIQATASEISWRETQAKTGRIAARGDHMLSMDDLFDVTMIVFLMAEPDGIPPLVEWFRPFIAGLELTAELEFAFTNVSALVRHIEEIDFMGFMQEAMVKAQSAIEVDPLHILPQDS